MKGNIDKKCYMCLLDNREVENMVRDKSRLNNLRMNDPRYLR